MNWRSAQIKDIAAPSKYSCVGGPFGSKLTGKDYVSEGIPVIRGANMGGRYISHDGLVFVTESKVHKDLLSNLAYPGDVVFTQRGTLGQVSMVPVSNSFDRYVVSQSQMKLTVDESKADVKFVYYYFSSSDAVKKILNYVSSSGVPHINLTVLRNFAIPLPKLDSQKEMASILSAYDDLIENNKRRIELLGDAARQLYKEWFERFRFPGHEHIKITDGVPEGWEKGSVGNIAKMFSGYAFKSKDWLDEGNPVIKIKNITANNSVDLSGCQCVDDNVAEKASRFKLLAGDMLIAMTGATVGKVGLMPSSEKSHYLNQRVGKFVSKIDRDVTPLLLSFFNSEKAQASILNLAGGAAQPNISAKQIESIEMAIPTETLLNAYLDETDKMFGLRLNLVDQNLKLTQARDLILPKLMSGEIVA
jgi:type I restriction enzyme, S subunit